MSDLMKKVTLPFSDPRGFSEEDLGNATYYEIREAFFRAMMSTLNECPAIRHRYDGLVCSIYNKGFYEREHRYIPEDVMKHIDNSAPCVHHKNGEIEALFYIDGLSVYMYRPGNRTVIVEISTIEDVLQGL